MTPVTHLGAGHAHSFIQIAINNFLIQADVVLGAEGAVQWRA